MNSQVIREISPETLKSKTERRLRRSIFSSRWDQEPSAFLKIKMFNFWVQDETERC